MYQCNAVLNFLDSILEYNKYLEIHGAGGLMHDYLSLLLSIKSYILAVAIPFVIKFASLFE